MHKILATVAAAAVLATGATAAQARTQQERSEERLAEMLTGFEQSGEPVNCIFAARSHDLQVLPYIGLVYESGDTIYVARASNPRMLDGDDVPVIERWSSQLCSNDVMRTFDRHNPNFSGVLFLEDFVPYRRVETEG